MIGTVLPPRRAAAPGLTRRQPVTTSRCARRRRRVAIGPAAAGEHGQVEFLVVVLAHA